MADRQPDDAAELEHELILVGIDFSPWASRAFVTARALALERHAELLVVHVVEMNNLDEIASVAGVSEALLRERIEHERRARLSELVRTASGNGGTVSTTEVVAWGHPFEQILKRAAEFAADMIVLGVAGRSADLERALFGGTAERVLRGATCPVLCVPS
jgi:nucleotide-binding universal stress UspA family protein